MADIYDEDDSSRDTFFEPDDSFDISIDSILDPVDGEQDIHHPVQIPSPKPKQRRNADPRGGGRPALHEMYPDIVPVATQIIKNNTFAADPRRRTTTGLSCGTSMPTLKRQLESGVRDLKSISTSSCGRLLKKPNKGHKASSYYKELIPAKVPPKCNNQRKKHIDAHYCNARVKLRREFAEDFKEEVCVFSCDCMAKLKVGVLATSRYHQIRRVHDYGSDDDEPPVNYADHDFPYPGYLLTISGYMRASKKETEGRFTADEHDRQHLNLGHTGPLHVVLSQQKFRDVNIAEHVNNMIPLLQSAVEEGKTCAVIISDGGPDWGPKSWAVLLYIVRLFKELNLDLLTLTNHAPYQSAYNMIEHCWAYLSGLLCGVILIACLIGEDKAPVEQSHLSAEERRQKEAAVFNNAMRDVLRYWVGEKFDGHPITGDFRPCLGREDRAYTDYPEVHKVAADGSRTTFQAHQDVKEELEFAVRHTERRLREITVKKCTNTDCNWCTSHPVRATNAIDFVRQHGNMPSPILSDSTPGSFRTYLEVKDLPNTGPVDDLMPGFQARLDKGLGRCGICPCYVFESARDKQRHMSILHRKWQHFTD